LRHRARGFDCRALPARLDWTRAIRTRSGERPMSTATPVRLMTNEEFLALPDDGTDRDLIRGVLWEQTMTRRGRRHSRAEARIAQLLGDWLETQPEPHGMVVSGEAGFHLSGDPETSVGIDVAYVSHEVAAVASEAALFEGPPVLAVEILSPSDTQERIDEKLAVYLETGVALVWVVNPRFRTVTVYRPDAPPVLFNDRQELTAEPHLPGFCVSVARLFGF
jgi:Uma2 family endonuclease